jgi:putative hydrolase of HD superfamily
MDYFTNSLLGRVNGGATGRDLRAAWQEYEDNETLESKFVHDIDKIELLLQMLEYERVNKHKLDLGEFSWVSTRIEMPEVKQWSNELLKEREDFWGDIKHSTWYEGNKLKDPPEKEEYYGTRPSLSKSEKDAS